MTLSIPKLLAAGALATTSKEKHKPCGLFCFFVHHPISSKLDWLLNKKAILSDCFSFLLVAEREGFEPPVPLSTPVFKTGVIDHSTISP